MPIQLTLDLMAKPQLKRKSIIKKEAWLDVTEIARGVGFTVPAQVSIALNDALELLRNETDGDYDQRLYDALWQAHLQLSLDHVPSATFNFNFTCKDGKTEEMREVSLHLHTEIKEDTIYRGRLEDF